MEHVHGFLTQNQYVVEPTFTLTTVNLREAFVLNQIPSDDITVMCVLISCVMFCLFVGFFQYLVMMFSLCLCMHFSLYVCIFIYIYIYIA